MVELLLCDPYGEPALPPFDRNPLFHWAAGARPMLTLMGTKLIPNSSSIDLPTVHLTWSCPASSSTHWVAVPGHTGHAAVVPALYGIDHRVVFWIANDGTKVRIAPEGRYGDYLESKLVTAVGGGKTFEVRLAAYNAVFTGRLVRNGTIFQLKNAVVNFDGTPVSVADQNLTALD